MNLSECMHALQLFRRVNDFTLLFGEQAKRQVTSRFFASNRQREFELATMLKQNADC